MRTDWLMTKPLYSKLTDNQCSCKIKKHHKDVAHACAHPRYTIKENNCMPSYCRTREWLIRCIKPTTLDDKDFTIPPIFALCLTDSPSWNCTKGNPQRGLFTNPFSTATEVLHWVLMWRGPSPPIPLLPIKIQPWFIEPLLCELV